MFSVVDLFVDHHLTFDRRYHGCPSSAPRQVCKPKHQRSSLVFMLLCFSSLVITFFLVAAPHLPPVKYQILSCQGRDILVRGLVHFSAVMLIPYHTRLEDLRSRHQPYATFAIRKFQYLTHICRILDMPSSFADSIPAPSALPPCSAPPSQKRQTWRRSRKSNGSRIPMT